MIDIHITTHLPNAGFPYGCLYVHVRDHNTEIAFGYNAMHPDDLPEAKQTLIDLEGMLIQSLERVQSFQALLSANPNPPTVRG